MDNDVNDLYQAAMRPFMEEKAKTHKMFFTAEEFKENIGEIFILTGAAMRLRSRK